jgi:dTDP-4-dehydrorhamnose reductase
MLIIGSGMVASALYDVACEEGGGVLLLPHDQLDVTDGPAVLDAVRSARPALIFHTAAMTRVNYCEEHPAAARLVNGDGARNVCQAAQLAGAELVYFSTDYVFDGAAQEPYLEDAPPNPLNEYGRSKLVGEQAVAAYGRGHIVRTSGVFGPRADGKPERNFFRAIAQQILAGVDPISVVSDQTTAVTYAPHLAALVFGLLRADGLPPLVHLTSQGSGGWADWAGVAADALGAGRGRLAPTTAAEYGGAVRRPAYSVLGSFSAAAREAMAAFQAQPAVEQYVREVERKLKQ